MTKTHKTLTENKQRVRQSDWFQTTARTTGQKLCSVSSQHWDSSCRAQMVEILSCQLSLYLYGAEWPIHSKELSPLALKKDHRENALGKGFSILAEFGLLWEIRGIYFVMLLTEAFQEN